MSSTSELTRVLQSALGRHNPEYRSLSEDTSPVGQFFKWTSDIGRGRKLTQEEMEEAKQMREEFAKKERERKERKAEDVKQGGFYFSSVGGNSDRLNPLTKWIPRIDCEFELSGNDRCTTESFCLPGGRISGGVGRDVFGREECLAVMGFPGGWKENLTDEELRAHAEWRFRDQQFSIDDFSAYLRDLDRRGIIQLLRGEQYEYNIKSKYINAELLELKNKFFGEARETIKKAYAAVIIYKIERLILHVTDTFKAEEFSDMLENLREEHLGKTGEKTARKMQRANEEAMRQANEDAIVKDVHDAFNKSYLTHSDKYLDGLHDETERRRAIQEQARAYMEADKASNPPPNISYFAKKGQNQ